MPWDGHIPTRNVEIRAIEPAVLLANVMPPVASFPMHFATYDGVGFSLEASLLDKVNAVVGDKNSGKSHTAKHIVHSIARHGAPIWVFDVNREFVDLPGAVPIRIGDNYRLSLAEVGFPFVMALVDEMNPLQDVSRGAFEHNGPRFVQQEIDASGFATIGHMLERAERSNFHNNEMVNRAIETRLRMLERSGLFESDPSAQSLADRFDDAVANGGFLVFDLAEQRMGSLKAITAASCDGSRRSARTSGGRAGIATRSCFSRRRTYTPRLPGILNLITRGRHLGITTVYMTNSPSELPDVIFRQLDNLIVTGLSHSADLRLIAKSALSDEDTLESIAVGLGQSEALIVGRLTSKFPLVVEIDPLPAGFPTTGRTRSFWDHAGGHGPGAEAA